MKNIFLSSLLAAVLFAGSCSPDDPIVPSRMTREDSLDKYEVIATLNGMSWHRCSKGSLPSLGAGRYENYVSIGAEDF